MAGSFMDHLLRSSSKRIVSKAGVEVVRSSLRNGQIVNSFTRSAADSLRANNFSVLSKIFGFKIK